MDLAASPALHFPAASSWSTPATDCSVPRLGEIQPKTLPTSKIVIGGFQGLQLSGICGTMLESSSSTCSAFFLALCLREDLGFTIAANCRLALTAAGEDAEIIAAKCARRCGTAVPMSRQLVSVESMFLGLAVCDDITLSPACLHMLHDGVH
jgi:hypothetical protein